MASEKPTAGFVLSLVGGIFWVLQAVVFFALASMMESLGAGLGFAGMGAVSTLLGGISLLFAVLILLGAAMMYARPAQAKIWGIVTLVFAVIGFFFVGGFYIGSILALVGGILGIVWKPPMQPMAQPMAQAPPPG